MSSEEEKKILEMVEDGKISPEEAMALIKALEEPSAETGPSTERSTGIEFEEVKARAQRFAMIPVWIGVAFTVLGAYWMFAQVQNANYGFLFFCAWFPLLLGLLLLALTAGGKTLRWLYVNVDQAKGEWPQQITFGFPIPIGIISWIIRNFGHFIRENDKSNVDEILLALSLAENLDNPLIINVDEGERGEKVQVYIG